jgi:hypothetical protein
MTLTLARRSSTQRSVNETVATRWSAAMTIQPVSASALRDPAAALRSLIQEGIVTAAALTAREDLMVPAMSMQRLGSLSSGMWRALSRELTTAAERLEREADEHLDDLDRRARAQEVDPDAVLQAGVAAGHLDEHRETLERVLATLDEDVRRLAQSDVLLGFSVDDEVALGEEQLDEDEVGTSDDSVVDDEDEADGDDDASPAIDVLIQSSGLPLQLSLMHRLQMLVQASRFGGWHIAHTL